MTIQNRKYLLYLLAIINFTHIVDSMLIMPLGEIFIEEFNISSGQYSLLVSSYALAAFFSSLFGIVFIDRFSRKRALITMYSGFAVGTFLCAFADSYYLLLTLRTFTGFFGGIISALVLSVISDLFVFKERGAAMGVLFMSFSAASALGIPIGIYLASQGSWATPFLIIGTIGLMISALTYFIFPILDDHLKSQAKSINLKHIFQNIFGDKNQVNALLAGFVLVLAHFMIIPFISPYMIRNVGLSQMEISYQFLFGGLATVITSPIIGRMTDKYGVMKVFITVLFLSFIPTYIITNLSFQPLILALTYTTMFFIFASGRMISPNTIITAASKPANRGGFMSVKSAFQQLAIALAALVSGQIVTINSDTNLYENYQYVGYLSIFLGISVIFLIKKIKVAEGN